MDLTRLCWYKDALVRIEQIIDDPIRLGLRGWLNDWLKCQEYNNEKLSHDIAMNIETALRSFEYTGVK